MRPGAAEEPAGPSRRAGWPSLARLAALLVAIGPAAAGDPPLRLSVAAPGEPDVVFRWRTDRCTETDIPDAPFRAFRRADGAIVAFASHYEARRFLGRSLEALKRDCRVVFRGGDDPDPKAYDARAWIVAVWTADGRSLVALTHNEYQAHRFPGRCAYATYSACWYNYLGEARSDDGGETFATLTRGAPLVAVARGASEEQGRPRGFFGSSNLISHGGFLHAFTTTTGEPSQPRGVCLLRSPRPFDPGSWEMLTADGFVAVRQRPVCRVIDNLFGDVTSVVRHRSSGMFIAVTVMPGGPDKGRVAFSTSADLVTWSPPVGFLTLPTQFAEGCQSLRYLYPAIIDPEARSRNFEDVGAHADLYLTRARLASCDWTMERDLVRFRIDIAARE